MKYEQYTLHDTRRSKKTYFKIGRIVTETKYYNLDWNYI